MTGPARHHLRVLIVGGTGMFGGRLVGLLAHEPRLTLLVASRSRARAEAVLHQAFPTQPPPAELIPTAFDRTGDLAAQLAQLAPDLVVDASGPFQAYDSGAYALVRAAIAQGADYADLADATAFVTGIAALDAQARAAGRFALSGASSVPALSCAVVRRLSRDLTRPDRLRIGIAPSPHARVGHSVVQAIASYAGRPVAIWRGGAKATGRGLLDSSSHVIGVPGHLPLPRLRFSLVDVPDLQIAPALWPTLDAVWVGAALRPAGLQRVLNGAAWLVRLRLLPALTPLAGLMHWAVGMLRWGEHRGGMFVEVRGTDSAGGPRVLRWHLLAEGDDGPRIPSMAVAALVQRCLEGRRPPAGARAAHGDLELEDFDQLFARHAITTAVIEPPALERPVPLYRGLLQAAYERLDPPLRRLHDVHDAVTATGRASVVRGAGPVPALIAGIMGFPPAGRDRPVTVRFSVEGRRERWLRTFGDHRMTSTQEAGTGANEGLLVERFGPLAFAMAVLEQDGRLSLVMRRWTAFGVPMPRLLAPRMTAGEHGGDGRFNFLVDIALPLVGRIVRYEGWLVPAADPAPDPAAMPAAAPTSADTS